MPSHKEINAGSEITPTNVFAPNLGPSHNVPMSSRGRSRQMPERPIGKLNTWCRMMAIPYTPPGANFSGEMNTTNPMDMMNVPKIIKA